MNDIAAAPTSGTILQDAPDGKASTRRRWLTILAIVVGIILAVLAIHHFFFVSPSEETDDSYVGGDIVSITSREAGTVIAIHADNTQAVRSGQALIDLDPATSDVTLAAAEAGLASAVRGVRSDISKVDETGAEVAQAQAELARARNDLARRQGAAKEGAVSGEEVAHAADTVTSAKATLALAISRQTQARTTVQGVSVSNNPAVLAAIAQYRNAAILASHMHIVAPVDGVIGQRTVQLGQRVSAGMPLMAVVPMRGLWIDANFRETQLRDIRIGQPATITTDVYGGDVVFHGRVEGLGAGSGSAFALLPPQNASGNWIKIVQRLPVRIAIDPRDIAAHPLSLGLSADVTVDTSDTSGVRIARPSKRAPTRAISQDGGPDVDREIARIIAANSAPNAR